MPAAIADLLAGQFSLVAYIGPGADLALISSAIGLAATMGASLTFLVLWPFRLLWRRLSALRKPAGDNPRAQSHSSASQTAAN